MAVNELARVRTKFVEKASKEVIKQLLDDLLEDNILNEGEKDSILEENKSRVDKARCLIDTVKRKGDAASRMMITSIQKRDKMLYSELGLSCAAEAPKMQEQTTTHTSTTEKVQRKKRNKEDVYPVTQDYLKSRVALLITNIKFSEEKLNRHGAEKDEENMEKLLKHLGYEVVKHRDLTGKGIDDAVLEFSKHRKLKTTDSVVVVIMSHGKRDAICGVNGETDLFPNDNIYKHLGSQNCPDLLNKPKIIIIQACRGGECGSVLVSDSAQTVVSDSISQSASLGDKGIKADALKRVNQEKDFITLLSSTPNTVAYRHEEHGSFLIQFIVEIFHQTADENHILELFMNVQRRFEEFSSDEKMQMPSIERCTLLRHFYFFPVDNAV